MSILGFAEDIAVWGFSLWNDPAPGLSSAPDKNPRPFDAGVAVAEDHRGRSWWPMGALWGDVLWDLDAEYLSTIERWNGLERMPVPEWWALPAVSEYVRLTEEAA